MWAVDGSAVLSVVDLDRFCLCVASCVCVCLSTLARRQERDAAAAGLEAAEKDRDSNKARLRDLVVKYKSVQAVSRNFHCRRYARDTRRARRS